MIATNTPPPTSTPIRASSHGTAPVPRLASTPATIPGRVIAFGMIWSWRSIAVIAMSAARRAAATTKRAVGPNAAYADRNAAPVTASTTGYRHEIGSAHARQRPRRSANERSGRLSYHAIAAPQPGHAEPGCQRLRRSGRRAITTFRKLPTMRPNRQTVTSARSITSPRRQQRGPDLTRHRGTLHPEDPERGARGVGLTGLEKGSDQPVPGLGRIELELDRMSELPKRLVGSSELEEDVPQGRVRRDVLGRESYRRLNRRERLVGLVRFHERRRQVVDGVGVVRVLPEVDPVAVDRVLEVAGPRVDEAHVIVLLKRIGSDLQRVLELFPGKAEEALVRKIDAEVVVADDALG